MKRMTFALIAFAAPAPVLAQTLIREWSGATLGEAFGSALAIVGDIDGDGTSDVLVGAPTLPNWGTSVAPGSARLFSGRSGALLRTFNGGAPSEHFGRAVCGLGDIDGDGVPDIAIGAPAWDGFKPALGVGRVALYSGANFATLRVLQGDEQDSAFGYALAGGEDIDGDGVPDLIVGAPLQSAIERGRAFVYSGATGEEIRSHGGGMNQNAGFSVAFSGDVDGDGLSEYLVGRPCVGTFTTNGAGGFVDAYRGSDGALLWTENAQFSPSDEEFGYCVGRAGDWNGDGARDVMLGARSFGTVYSAGIGYVRIVDGLTGVQLKVCTAPPDYLFSGFGQSATYLDMNFDGLDDPVIGAPGAGWTNECEATVVRRGGGNGTLLTLPNVGDYERFGHALAAGDLDGDGLPELIGGVPSRGYGTVCVYTLFKSPAHFCVAQINSFGCTPQIASTGTPSVSSTTPFDIRATSVLNNKLGFAFYGMRPTVEAFHGGMLCVGQPRKRTFAQYSNGNAPPEDCSGVFTYDFNARIHSGVDVELVAGVDVFAQYWSRDPTAQFQSNLSDAIAFRINP